MAFGGPPTPPRNAEHLRPLLNGFADISQPAGSLNFRPHFQCMNGWERQKIIDHPGHWKSVKCEFLSDIYRHSTVSFMFFPASAPDDSAVRGVLCLGTLENSFLFFVVREGRTPPEIASIFDDPDIAKIGFDSEKCVRDLRRCAVFERINNVLSLRDKFDFDFWNNSVIIDRLNEVTRLTDRVKIGGDLIKFVLLCTRHDAYKLAVRKYNFELDLSAKPDDSAVDSYIAFLLTEHRIFLLDICYFNQSSFLIYYHDHVRRRHSNIRDIRDFVHAAGRLFSQMSDHPETS